MTDIPWGELDPGIRPVVAALLTAGFETYASCEGGEGHASVNPTILLIPGRDVELTRVTVSTWLRQRGLAGCYVKVVYLVNIFAPKPADVPDEGPFVEIEWWGRNITDEWIQRMLH